MKVFFNENATRAEENRLKNKLQANPEVKVGGVKYVPKSVAFKDMKKTNPALTEGLAYNPLPDSFEVTPTKGEYVQSVAASLNPLPPGVNKVTDGKQLSKRILQVAHAIWVRLPGRHDRAQVLIASTCC